MKKMQKLRQYVMVLAVTFILTGCAAYARGPVVAMIQFADGGVSASQNTQYSKKGEATCTSVFGLLGYGDCTIRAAANNGGIHEISHVDSKTLNIIGIYASYTTIVYGN